MQLVNTIVDSGFGPLFTGKERDPESGNDYFGARYYNSATGRFLSPDPGPNVKQDPQAWNRYVYSRNNPMKYIDPTGKYIVVAAAMQQQVQQYISTMLRNPQGAATINSMAGSRLPVSFDTGALPVVHNGNGTMNVTAGQTSPVPGTNSPGGLAGVGVTLDNANISTVAHATGKSDFAVGLDAFAHEDQHVTDELSAGTLQGAAAAGANGDAPTEPGAGNTTGGTAEARAEQIMGALGAAGQSYQPDPAYDADASAIIQQGAEQQSSDAQQSVNKAVQRSGCSATSEGQTCD